MGVSIKSVNLKKDKQKLMQNKLGATYPKLRAYSFARSYNKC
jgi:hypothetical protein